MAEPTDITKNMSTAEKMVQNGTLAFRQYMDIPYIPEEEEFLFKEFGGKPGQGRIKTPKKLTVKQAFALLDYSGFPLADENAKFAIASSIKLSAPELFDDADFEAYEKKFGDVMRMQEEGASASKNITTAKTPVAANDPSMSIADKIKNQTLTIGEAIEMGPEDKRPAVRKAVEKAGKSLDDSWFTIGENEFLIKLNEVGTETNFTTLATVQSAVEQQAAINDLSPPPNVFKAGGKARKLELKKASQGRGTKAFKQVPGAQQSLPVLTEGIGTIKDPSVRAAVAFNALVPLRPGEVAMVRIEDIDFEAGRFTEEFRRGNKIRNALDLPEVSLEILRDAAEKAKAEGREYLFLPKGTDTDLTSKAAKKARTSFVNKMTAGVKAPGGIAERFKPFESILGRKIEGVKDIRKIIPSIIASELGYASEASTILGHDNFDDTIDGLKGITSKHYVSQVMTQEGTTAKQALRALQNMYGEVLGLSTLNELPASMGVTAAGLEAVEAPRLAVIPKGQDIVGTQVQGKLTDADLDLIDDVREARSQELKLTATQAEAERLRLEAQMPEIDEAAIRAKEERRLLEQTIKKEVRSKITAESATDPLSTVPEEDVDKLKRLGLWERFGGKLAIGAATSLGVYSFLTDPAQAAVDVGLEVGARALGAAAGPAAAVPMIMSPTELGEAEATPDMRPATQEELMSQVRQREADRMARRKREATAEAAMQEGDSFMTMQP